jgi:hypothetical protein
MSVGALKLILRRQPPSQQKTRFASVQIVYTMHWLNTATNKVTKYVFVTKSQYLVHHFVTYLLYFSALIITLF